MLPDVCIASAQCCKHLLSFLHDQVTWSHTLSLEHFCPIHKLDMARDVCVGHGCAGVGRAHAAEQRKERESLEELIHSIQLESELTSRALRQSVSVRSFCSPAVFHHVSPWLLTLKSPP